MTHLVSARAAFGGRVFEFNPLGDIISLFQLLPFLCSFITLNTLKEEHFWREEREIK